MAQSLQALKKGKVISMDYIQQLYAERLGGEGFGAGTELFKFEKIKRAKRMALLKHPGLKLIDLGVGEPDETAAEGIIRTLCEQAGVWENRGYADNGIQEFAQAAAVYMERVYGVTGLNSAKEILPVMGSKSALSLLPQAFINPGEVTLITVPGYPVLGTITRWLGGDAYLLALKPERDFLPDLKGIPEEILQRAKLLYLNYPNNPTGGTATEEFYKEVVSFAKKHRILVIQDAAYAALTYGGEKPLSFLAVPGAREVGIEVHSLSKAFAMTGWRLGFVCGNEKAIAGLAAVKDNHDSGQFRAIQHAGVYALCHPELTQKACEKYERRHHKLTRVLSKIGFEVKPPKASFYQYARIAKGTQEGRSFENAEQFSEYMIQNALISAVPWDEEGHFVRFSVTYTAADADEEDRVMKELYERLLSMKLLF